LPRLGIAALPETGKPRFYSEFMGGGFLVWGQS
jgi:hypothetical protein